MKTIIVSKKCMEDFLGKKLTNGSICAESVTFTREEIEGLGANSKIGISFHLTIPFDGDYLLFDEEATRYSVSGVGAVTYKNKIDFFLTQTFVKFEESYTIQHEKVCESQLLRKEKLFAGVSSSLEALYVSLTELSYEKIVTMDENCFPPDSNLEAGTAYFYKDGNRLYMVKDMFVYEEVRWETILSCGTYNELSFKDNVLELLRVNHVCFRRYGVITEAPTAVTFANADTEKLCLFMDGSAYLNTLVPGIYGPAPFASREFLVKDGSYFGKTNVEVLDVELEPIAKTNASVFVRGNSIHSRGDIHYGGITRGINSVFTACNFESLAQQLAFGRVSRLFACEGDIFFLEGALSNLRFALDGYSYSASRMCIDFYDGKDGSGYGSKSFKDELSKKEIEGFKDAINGKDGKPFYIEDLRGYFGSLEIGLVQGDWVQTTKEPTEDSSICSVNYPPLKKWGLPGQYLY